MSVCVLVGVRIPISIRVRVSVRFRVRVLVLDRVSIWFRYQDKVCLRLGFGSR